MSQFSGGVVVPPTPWYKENPFWGAIGLFVAFVLTGVVSGASGQLTLGRWLLAGAWPCGLMVVWLTLNGLTNSVSVRIGGRIVAGLGLGLFLALGGIWMGKAVNPVQRTNAETKPPVEPPPQKIPPTTAVTFETLFRSDFPNLTKHGDQTVAIHWNSGYTLPISTQIYLDFPAKSEFVGFFIPHYPRTYEACLRLVDAVIPAINRMKENIQMTAGDAGGSDTLDDLVFSGRVFLYYEYPLTITEKAEIIKVYKRKKFDASFRGPG